MFHFCFDPLHAVGEFSCKGIGWPINSSGGGSRIQGVACGPPRACGAKRNRTTHRLKVSLRRAGRSIGETSATPRALSCRAGWKACRCPRWPDHVADIETLLRTISAPLSQCARFDRPGASLPNKGSLVFATIRCAIKTLIKTSWVCRRSLALGQNCMRMLRIHA